MYSPLGLQVIFMEKYSHLSHEERSILRKLVNFYDVRLVNGRFCACSPEHQGSISLIARMLGQGKSTISRELKANWTAHGYDPDSAHTRARKLQKAKGKRRIPKNVEPIIDFHLRRKRSPMQIASLLRQEMGIMVSHEWIYRYVYDTWQGHRLPRRHRHREPRSTRQRGRGVLRNQTPITERPQEANARTEPGHWEVDTMEFARHRGGLVVMVERTSRLILAELVTRRTSRQVGEAVKRMVHAISRREAVRTITSDNGKEWACHKDVTQSSGVKWYFAHPRRPWERGTEENAIGLLRRWYPKGMGLQEAMNIDLQEVLIELNLRPRHLFRGRKSSEVFYEQSNIANVALTT